MGLTDVSKEAARASSESEDSTGSSGEEYERMDITDASYVKLHPGPTAIKGEIVGLRYFPPDPNSQDERGWIGAVLEDPEIPDDADFEAVSIFESTTDTGDDFKLVNADDSEVDTYDAGVSVGKMFESDEVDAFDDGQYVVKMSTGSGRSVARTLDCNGLPNFDWVRTDDGEIEIQDNGFPTSNRGLVEKHPDNDDNNYTPPRFARDPQLRDEVEGREVILMLQRTENVIEDYSGDSYWATVLADLDDEDQTELTEMYAGDSFYDYGEADQYIEEFDGAEFTNIAPTSDGTPEMNLLVETEWTEWSWPSDAKLEQLREAQDVVLE